MSEAGRMILDLLVLFVFARIAGAICERVRQPAVVGELLVGIAIGPHLLGLVSESEFQELFAQLGVVFLLFVVGLETDPRSLLRVGHHAAAVGTAGVLLPFGLGFALMHVFGHSSNESLFMGAALTATSVGITARVMSDLGRIGTVVARVILGAAVFDDILGLLVLAVVSGMATGTLSGSRIALLAGESLAFCVLAVVLGRPAVHRLGPRVARRATDASRDPLFALAVALCFAFSALADWIGLAGIVGAFLAGIVFAEIPEAPALRRSMQPIYELLVPIFFVLMGSGVDARQLVSWEVLPLGLLITLAAIVGKVGGCGLSALPLGRREALAVGVGMVPRGEVGLVVAMVGLSRHVIGGQVYAMVILMCVVTSLIAPPLLRLTLAGEPLPGQEGMAEEGRP